MKAILTILIVVCFSMLAQAQTAYQGGSGDGYAMDELVLRQVGVEELESSIKVYPTLLKSGELIKLELVNNETLTIELTDLNGRTVIQQQVEGNATINTDELAAGNYLFYTTTSKAKAIRITILQ